MKRFDGYSLRTANLKYHISKVYKDVFAIYKQKYILEKGIIYIHFYIQDLYKFGITETSYKLLFSLITPTIAIRDF